MSGDFIEFEQLAQEETDMEDVDIKKKEEGADAEGDSSGEDAENDTEKGAESDAGNGIENPTDDTDQFLEFSFNNEMRTLNRDEAVAYALKGLELEGMHKKLDYLANADGKSVEEFLETLLTARESAHRQELESRISDENAVNDLMDLYRTREKEKYEQVLLGRNKAQEEAKKSREGQIAEDFLKLQKEFPDIADFKSLPNEVKRAAANGEGLLSAYLLFKHREGQAVKKAEESAKAASAASSGSMSSEAGKHEEAYAEFKRSLFETN